MAARSIIPTRVIPSVEPSSATPRAIDREFRELIDDGAKMRPAGEAKHKPRILLDRGYGPKNKIDLFDTTFYLSNARQNPDLRFMVAYVVQVNVTTGRREIFPRIFYKDISLIWRSASHLVMTDDELWIGKGDVRLERVGGDELYVSVESTTDLPIEMQQAMETLNRRRKTVPHDIAALPLVLRGAPPSRVLPYADFTAPRARAAATRRNLINGGKSVAYFTRKNDPTSLKFAPGFEPDFARGVMDESSGRSAMYQGQLSRYRILSKNRKIQYIFFHAPKHAWMIPPQAVTTELSSFGVRTVDVIVDEDAFVPGYEYHFMDDSVDPPVLHTQIPEGFAGEPNPQDDSRADASAWLEKLPVIRKFRKMVGS